MDADIGSGALLSDALRWEPSNRYVQGQQLMDTDPGCRQRCRSTILFTTSVFHVSIIGPLVTTGCAYSEDPCERARWPLLGRTSKGEKREAVRRQGGEMSLRETMAQQAHD